MVFCLILYQDAWMVSTYACGRTRRTKQLLLDGHGSGYFRTPSLFAWTFTSLTLNPTNYHKSTIYCAKEESYLTGGESPEKVNVFALAWLFWRLNKRRSGTATGQAASWSFQGQEKVRKRHNMLWHRCWRKFCSCALLFSGSNRLFRATLLCQ